MSGLGGLLSVLMVGHSLFGQTGPDMLQEALRAGRGKGEVRAQIINGAPLRYNWEESDKAEGVDARSVLPEGGTTHLILTEAIPLANHTRWSDTEVYAQAFFGLAAAANPTVKVYLQETWHSLKSGSGEAVEHDAQADIPWRQRLDEDLPAWESIVDAVARGRTSDSASVSLIPAGQAMARLYDEIAADRIPELRGIDALFADDIHLNDLGHYFVAMVQYATLTKSDPLGLPTDFSDGWGKAFDTPSPELARHLQRVAWAAVRDYQGGAVVPVPPPAPVRLSASEQSAPVAPNAPPPAPALPDPIAADSLPTVPAAPKSAENDAAPAQADKPARPFAITAPPDAVPGTTDLGIGLAAIADWSTQQPFLDLMKTARPWLGHLAGRFGGMEYEELLAGGYLDAEGWPVKMPRKLGSIGTLILTDMPEAATSLKGRYVLRFEGSGIIEVTGRAQNVRYGKNTVSFDYTPGPGSVDIRIQRINSKNPPRNITVLREDRIAAYDSGAQFNPDWTRHLENMDVLRFMDWMMTNNSPISAWKDRPRPEDVTYALRGVPVEVMVSLANELGIDPWFNLPHLAQDDYVTRFADHVKDALSPRLTAHVEYSNEVWNWQFTQTAWADEQAQARWDEAEKGMQFYGVRAAEVAKLWTEVFGNEAETRLRNVISTQTGWLGLETEALEAPLFVAETAGNQPPVEAFDAYAVTGYFGGVLGLEDRGEMVHGWLNDSAAQARAEGEADGLSGEGLEAHIAAHRFDAAAALAEKELRNGAVSGDANDTLADLIGRVWPYHAAVARAHDLDLVMYEGGSHVVGLGAQVDDDALTAFFHHLNYAPEMGALYADLLAGWQAVGGQLFTHYSDVYTPTKWGAWGALRHLDDDNPRWQALQTWE
ncbi:hypothetical protein [Sulfitobacter delicatus]|uniref:Uncharacterized protein n=1 Tax=Sulfitobacter delicatus TaxID=218672 RepID=A0A1G7LI20_9RHOB|nr:hypothetical protein SAMN04489759_102298 [Sulfitobacter delicatus]